MGRIVCGGKKNFTPTKNRYPPFANMFPSRASGNGFLVSEKKGRHFFANKLPSRVSGSGWGRGTSLSLQQPTRDWRGGRKPVAKGNGVGRAPRNPGKPVTRDLDAELADACPVFKRKHVQKKTIIKSICQKVNHVRIIEFNQKY